MGILKATTILLVFMTSNQERRLEDPFRRRSSDLIVEQPTAEREAANVKNKTPKASPGTHRFIAGLAKAFPIHDPAAWQQDESTFGHRVLDHFKPHAVLLCGFGGVRSGIALIDIGEFDRRVRYLLHLLGERCDLIAISLVGRRHGQRQKLAQRVDRNVHLGPFAPLGTVLSNSRAALGCALQSSAVDAHSRWLALAARPLAHDGLHVGHQRLEHTRLQPAPHLLIHRPPGTVFVRKITLLSTRPRRVPNTVEHTPQSCLR